MRAFLFLAVLLLVPAAGCGKKERAPLFGQDDDADGGSAGAAGAKSSGGPAAPIKDDIELGEEPCEGAPDPDTSLLCGNQVVPVLVRKPNLYFVVDQSGSMEEPIALDRTKTKMDAVRESIIEVTEQLGHRISYGLAAYPGDDDPSVALLGCGPGAELFPTQEGDPLVCLNQRGGEVHDAFSAVVRGLRSGGGTPLSGTLQALAPTLLGLDGQTAIILLTDGAPNCNPDASCGIDGCIPNIEGGALPSGFCDANFNCCDSAQISEVDEPYIGIPEAACVDDAASLEAVAQFREAGLLTFVIGVPGSELYGDVMTSLAEAGGTLRSGTTGYYDVGDVDDLLGALAQIGTEIALGCQVKLQSPVADPDLLNVYFDEQIVEQDSEEGWLLDGDEVRFVGQACDALSAGQVAQVQLVSGCRTVIR